MPTRKQRDLVEVLADHDKGIARLQAALGRSDNHTRYTDAEAIAAVDDGTYLKLTGGTLTGSLVIGGDLEVSGDIRASGVGARMYRDATSQAIAATTSTVVDWDATSFDTNALVDLASNYFVIPSGYGGIYVVNSHIQWIADPGAVRYTVRVNSATVGYLFRSDGGVSGAYGDASGSLILQLADGDVVDFIVYYGAASYVRGGILNSSASIAKIA